MKTPRDILAQHIMWAKADWATDNHAQADKALVDLEAAGYVIVPKEPTETQEADQPVKD